MRNRTNATRDHRPSFTLIELLVVIGLIVVITAIGIIMIPLFRQQNAATQNASQVVSWLHGAKVKALAQQRATGLRLVPDPNNPLFVRELQFVQTPDDYAGGMGDNSGGRLYQPGDPLTGMASKSVALVFSNVDFFGGLTDATEYPVQPGDYLEIAGGQLYQIYTVPSLQTLTVSPLHPATVPALTYDPLLTLPFKQQNGLTGYYTTQWRIIRQPRRMPGEDSLTLNGNAVIDLGPGPNGVPLTLSPNVPMRTTPGQTYYEILFAPNGGVVGRGTVGSDRIVLWVHDSTQSDPTANGPALISVQVRTGFIGSYPVDMNGADPYSLTRDPRAGGQ
jgi:hypothetical protein